MDRMEHFHGAKVLDGEKVVLDGVEGHLGCHVRAAGRKQWYGYFELDDTQHLDAGARYRLDFGDGRHADINAADIDGQTKAGPGRHVAQFYVVGEVRGHGHRRLDHGPRRLG